ncbi:MAG: hypothetical protein EBX41_09790 [Chitinophagia bacterium]|nr:hypothetical protein [Chitinophagia bacterium]
MPTKIKPILFNNWSVKRLIRGTKTQTRRIVKDVKELQAGLTLYKRCPFEIGDILWVREAFRIKQVENEELEYIFSTHEHSLGEDFSNLSKWKPSIHLPKDKSRILLKVVYIWRELLQNITEEDAIKEGAENYGDGPSVKSCKEVYFGIWEDINGIGSVAKNPEVWVIEFEILSTDLQTTQNLLKEFADGAEQ